MNTRINQNSSNDIKAVCAPSDQIFWDFLDYPQLIDGLPVYNGELVMKMHGVGCYSSWSKIKLKNRQNERAATDAEHASVMANFFSENAWKYPKEKLWFAWFRFLDHQMHDDLTGTSINNAYTQYTIPAQDSSLAEFKEVMTDANTEMAKYLNTTVETGRVPVVVYNPLAINRKDICETVIQWSGTLPEKIQVFGPDGKEVPSQIIQRAGSYLSLAFAADMPSMGYKVYQVSPTESSLTSELKITTSELENEHYKVTVDNNGDIAQVYDKKLQKNLLASPSRFELRQNDGNVSFPAWEITYNSVTRNADAYVDDNVQKAIEENGPARVTLKVTRSANGSNYTHYIRLATGDAGSFVKVDNVVDWKQHGYLLKVSFPLACSNDSAAFDLGIGAIKRPNRTTNRYEVPGQKWADLTASDNSFGVSLLSDCKYGWDKVSNNQLNHTILHSPTNSSSGYDYYTGRDKYVHPFAYGIYGHQGKWESSSVVYEAERLDHPLIGYKATAGNGTVGKEFSFLQVNKPEQVAVMALKQAEKIDGYSIVRVRELKGESMNGAKLTFMGNVEDVYNVTGQEKKITTSSKLPRDKYKPGAVTKSGNSITFDLKRFQVRAFAVKLGDLVNIGSTYYSQNKRATVLFSVKVLQRNIQFRREPDEQVNKIFVTNMAGRVLQVIHNDITKSNSTTYQWNGQISNGGALSSGVYVVNVLTSKRHLSAKLPIVQ